jgi:hypothetical protein
MEIVLCTSNLNQTVGRLKVFDIIAWGQDGNKNCPTFMDMDGH